MVVLYYQSVIAIWVLTDMGLLRVSGHMHIGYVSHLTDIFCFQGAHYPDELDLQHPSMPSGNKKKKCVIY